MNSVTSEKTTKGQHQMRFFLYARKSTESEDRQVQSIEDQVDVMGKVANDLGLKVAKVLKEAKSAKAPFIRPIFTEMVARIQKGEANGILCWKIDRLFRNPVDQGQISWLLQNGAIKEIVTHDRTYRSADNVVILGVEGSMANQYLLDLSKNVKRGIRSKVESGGWPGSAPVGYMNRLEDHTVIPDPDRFPLLRKAWDLMLTGSHTVPSILQKLNNEWGFRTIKKRHSGNKPLAMSGLYKVFTNPFYVGQIHHINEVFKGVHQPMVSEAEFDRVQALLGRKGKFRIRKNNFAFTGFIRCGECGCLITAEVKTKYIKSEKVMRNYTYYHCTRRKPGVECSQVRAIREENLVAQLDAELTKYTILPEFRDWALEILCSSNDNEVNERTKTYEMLHASVTETQRQLDKLTDLKLRDLVTDDEYSQKKNELRERIEEFQKQLRQTEGRAATWMEITERVFYFAANARERFNKGDSQTRRSIITALGQNPTIIDGKVNITPYKWLQPIAEHYPALEKKYLTAEPTKNPSMPRRNHVSSDVISSWRAGKESNLRRRKASRFMPPLAVAVFYLIGWVGGVGIEPTKAQGQQIYSLPRLTTSVSTHPTYQFKDAPFVRGASDGSRPSRKCGTHFGTDPRFRALLKIPCYTYFAKTTTPTEVRVGWERSYCVWFSPNVHADFIGIT